MSGFPLVQVLVVDDKLENLIALQAAFKGSGYVVKEALSGFDALELVKHQEFACIILDVQMPELDGFQTAKFMRKEPLSQNTPIIFATAIHRTDEYEEMGYVAGAVDFLFKPINTTILRAKVAVFVELYLQSKELKKKNLLLEEAIQKTRENEKLKEALAARDEFLLMASHELMTPITPLSLQMETFIQLFSASQVDRLDAEKVLRMLYTSQGQVERLSRLIRELVDVSRLSAKKLELQLAPVNLTELLRKVLTDFKENIEKSGSSIVFHPGKAVVGTWDAFRIEQVIVNLLTNALKYGAGQPIQLKVEEVGETARLVVCDRGIGISPVDHERIFKRYERAVSPKSYSGLGLGLYISQQIAELHHGRISVESEHGAGAKFVLELPVRTPAPADRR